MAPYIRKYSYVSSIAIAKAGCITQKRELFVFDDLGDGPGSDVPERLSNSLKEALSGRCDHGISRARAALSAVLWSG